MTEHEIERMLIRLVGDATHYRRMLTQAQAATTNFAQRVEKDLMTLATRVALPLAAIGVIAVKSFSAFDKAMTETFAKMGRVTPEVREEMENLAKSMSTSGTTAFSPIELAKGYEQLASAGLDAGRSMKSLGITAKFAQAGAFSLEVAVKQLVGAMASFGITAQTASPAKFAKEMEHFSDVITGVANETTTGVEQVARAMSSDAAVAAKEYGASLEELGAILGVFALQNKDAEEAGHLTGRAFRLLTNSFNENGEVWKRMGIDIVDKSTGEFIKFADAIELIENAFEGLTGPQRVASLSLMGFEALARKAILPLIGNSKELRRQEQLYRKHGTTVEMAAIQMESFANQMKIAWNAAMVLGIEVGETLAPALLLLASGLKDTIGWFRSLSPTIKTIIVFTAALTVALIGLGVVTAIAGTIFNTMFGGIGIILGAIVTVAAALIAWEASIGGIAQAWEGVVKIASDAWKFIMRVSKSLIDALQPAIKEVVLQFTEMWGMVQIIFDEIAELAREVWEDMGEDAKEFWTWIEPVRVALMSLFTQFVRSALLALKGLLKGIIEIARVIIATFRFIRDFASGVWTTITGDAIINWGQIRDFIVDVIEQIEFNMANFGKLINLAWMDAGIGLFRLKEEIVHFFTNSLPAIGRGFLENWKGIFNALWETGKKTLNDLVTKSASTIQMMSDPKFWQQSVATRELVLKGIWSDFKLDTDDLMKNLPKIPPRVIGLQEEAILGERLDKLKEFEKAKDDFIKKKIGRGGIPGNVIKGGAEAAEKEADEVGKKVGKAFGEGIIGETAKEMQKLDAVLFHSAEALARSTEFTERIRSQFALGSVGSNPMLPPAPNPVGIQANAPHDNIKDEVVVLLKDIRDVLKLVEKKPLLNSSLAPTGTR